ncbi:MAG: LPS assembly lipoprotein LptE [Candidatus Thiodiazotropha sp. (ex. Lucinoma kazani)]
MLNSFQLTRLQPFWLLLILSPLVGCGFHLKGYQQPSTVLNGLYVMESDLQDSVASILRRDLQNGGVVMAPDAENARFSLQITQEKFSSRVLSVDANGKALDNEMQLVVTFRLIPADPDETATEQQLELVRQLSFSGSDELGQRNESALMVTDMRNDMASQIIRRLEVQLR